MNAKKFFIFVLAVMLALGGAASMKHFYTENLTQSSSEILSSSEADLSEIDESSEVTSSMEEISSEIISSEEPSSSEEVPEEPTVPLPSYLDGEPESEPVADDLNLLTGFTSVYKDQYSTADDPTGHNSHYFGAGIQEASNITSLGWTTTSMLTMTRRIPELNAQTSANYAFVTTNFWVSISNMSIFASWGTTSATTYQALLAVRKYIEPGVTSPWEIIYGPGGQSKIMGSSGVLDADIASGTDLYQVLFGFVSSNTSGSIRNLHLSIYSSV
jgi:hypothetical protein